MLQDLANRLVVPGLPEWSGLIALLVILFFALAFLFMPFSVFGLKGRLESLEAQLDEIHAEIRGLALQLPDPARRAALVEDDWSPPPRAAAAEPLRATPPVPPPAAWPNSRGGRSEPRLDWPGREENGRRPER